MQSTANYLWLISDLLGQGATANVYRGRHKVFCHASRELFFSLEIQKHSVKISRYFILVLIPSVYEEVNCFKVFQQYLSSELMVDSR